MSASALAAAIASIEEVRRFLAIAEREIDAVRQLLGMNPPLQGAVSSWLLDVSTFRSSRKYDYACAVVLLYGALERFIEDATEEYLGNLSRGTERYSSLPERLRASHFSQVVLHLQRTRDARYDGISSARDLVSALAGCLQDDIPYSLIAESMMLHTANFRPPVVDEFLGRAGIESSSRRAVASDPFASYLSATGRSVPDDRPESVLDLVNDLVVRRNEVSHGDMSNTLAPSELGPYCDLVEAYCKGLSSVLDDSLLGELVRFYGVDHGVPIAVYNHNIVCVHSKGEVITIGSKLALERTDGSWYSTNVKKIQIDGKEVSLSPQGRDVAIGLEIEGRCKDTYRVVTGVFERRGVPSASSVQTMTAHESHPAPSSVDLSALKDRRDEALYWLRKNGDGAQGGWLREEFEKYSADLIAAERMAGIFVEDHEGDPAAAP